MKLQSSFFFIVFLFTTIFVSALPVLQEHVVHATTDTLHISDLGQTVTKRALGDPDDPDYSHRWGGPPVVPSSAHSRTPSKQVSSPRWVPAPPARQRRPSVMPAAPSQPQVLPQPVTSQPEVPQAAPVRSQPAFQAPRRQASLPVPVPQAFPVASPAFPTFPTQQQAPPRPFTTAPAPPRPVIPAPSRPVILPAPPRPVIPVPPRPFTTAPAPPLISQSRQRAPSLRLDGSNLKIGLQQCINRGPLPPPLVELATNAIRFITDRGGRAFVMGGSNLHIRRLLLFTRQTGDVDLATYMPNWATFHQQVVSSGLFCVLDDHLAMYVRGHAYKIDIFVSTIFFPTSYPDHLLETLDSIPLLQLGPLVLQKQKSALARAFTHDRAMKQKNDILDAHVAMMYLGALYPMHFQSIISQSRTACSHHVQNYWRLVAQLHPDRYHEFMERWQKVLRTGLALMSDNDRSNWESAYHDMTYLQ